MKFIITESQVDSLCKVFEKFINNEDYEGVCDVGVDYDDVMDSFVLNIFFDGRFAVEKGSRFTAHIKKIINQVGNKFMDGYGEKPLLYLHYKNCS